MERFRIIPSEIKIKNPFKKKDSSFTKGKPPREKIRGSIYKRPIPVPIPIPRNTGKTR